MSSGGLILAIVLGLNLKIKESKRILRDYETTIGRAESGMYRESPTETIRKLHGFSRNETLSERQRERAGDLVTRLEYDIDNAYRSSLR